jgi:hypothetical protein
MSPILSIHHPASQPVTRGQNFGESQLRSDPCESAHHFLWLLPGIPPRGPPIPSRIRLTMAMTLVRDLRDESSGSTRAESAITRIGSCMHSGSNQENHT